MYNNPFISLGSKNQSVKLWMLGHPHSMRRTTRLAAAKVLCCSIISSMSNVPTRPHPIENEGEMFKYKIVAGGFKMKAKMLVCHEIPFWKRQVFKQKRTLLWHYHIFEVSSSTTEGPTAKPPSAQKSCIGDLEHNTTHKRMLHVTHENKNLLKGCLFLIPYKLYRYITYISHGCCTQPFQSQLKGPSMKFVRIYLCPGRKAVNIIYFGILKQQGPHCGTWNFVYSTYPLIAATHCVSARHGAILDEFWGPWPKATNTSRSIRDLANVHVDRGSLSTDRVTPEVIVFRMAQIRWLELTGIQKVKKHVKCNAIKDIFKPAHGIPDLCTSDISAVING